MDTGIHLNNFKGKVYFSLFFFALFLSVVFVFLLIHEGGHLVIALLLRLKVYGIYLSPFFGRVYCLTPPLSEIDPKIGIFALGGLIFTQFTGYTYYFIIKRIPYKSFFRDSFSLLFVLFFLLQDPSYFFIGHWVNNGDVCGVAAHFNIPRVIIAFLALGLFIFNLRIVRIFVRNFNKHYFSHVSRKDYVKAWLLFFILLSLFQKLVIKITHFI